MIEMTACALLAQVIDAYAQQGPSDENYARTRNKFAAHGRRAIDNGYYRDLLIEVLGIEETAENPHVIAWCLSHIPVEGENGIGIKKRIRLMSHAIDSRLATLSQISDASTEEVAGGQAALQILRRAASLPN